MFNLDCFQPYTTEVHREYVAVAGHGAWLAVLFIICIYILNLCVTVSPSLVKSRSLHNRRITDIGILIIHFIILITHCPASIKHDKTKLPIHTDLIRKWRQTHMPNVCDLLKRLVIVVIVDHTISSRFCAE